jgi:hypothetical protein
MPISPTLGSGSPAAEGHGHGILGAVTGFLDAHIVAPIALQLERARLRDELTRLDHRELKDLNISDPVSFADRWRPRF